MKRMFLLFAVVVAMLCSATIAHAQDAKAPQRHGWGYPYAPYDPIRSLYFPPLYGDVESVTIEFTGGHDDAIEYFSAPYIEGVYIFNTRGDVECVDGASICTWTYNDYGKVINFHSKCDISSEEYNVAYVYNSSAQLVGAYVTGDSDYWGEFSYNVYINKANKEVVELLGIDLFTTSIPRELAACRSNGEFVDVPYITDRIDLDCVNPHWNSVDYVGHYVTEGARFLIRLFDDDADYTIPCAYDDSIENILSDYSKQEVGYDPHGKFFVIAEVCGINLLSFNSNNKLILDFYKEGLDIPDFKTIFKYDESGRLLAAENSGPVDEGRFVCEYDDEGKLISVICYDPKYSDDGEYKVVGYEPKTVSNYVYDSHGNLIRIETKHLKNSYQEERYSSIEYLIRYRK